MQLKRPWMRAEFERHLARLSNPAMRVAARDDGSAPAMVAGLLDGCHRYRVTVPWWLETWQEDVHDTGVRGLVSADTPESDDTMTPEGLRQLALIQKG